VTWTLASTCRRRTACSPWYASLPPVKKGYARCLTGPRTRKPPPHAGRHTQAAVVMELTRHKENGVDAEIMRIVKVRRRARASSVCGH